MNPSERLEFEPLGLLRPGIDVHTMGPGHLSELLDSCGVRAVLETTRVSQALLRLESPAHASLLAEWLNEGKFRSLGFSYRLDPGEGLRLFRSLARFLEAGRYLARQGGAVRKVWFAGLPETCRMVRREFPWVDACFDGDQSDAEVLAMMGIPAERIPQELHGASAYDTGRMDLAAQVLSRELDQAFRPCDLSAGRSYGSRHETLQDRLEQARKMKCTPLMRAHAGPWLPDRKEAVRLFCTWAYDLARAGYLDILSIGTSQLSQERFEESWDGLADGGGVPLQNRLEFHEVWQAARPMLVRTYAGSRRVDELARVWEETINPAWHTFSFWWFNKLDGRGPLDLGASLEEHFAALDVVAKAGRPFEANVAHHFSFRGGDDLTAVFATYLAAKAARSRGIRTFILQVMLNTPRHLNGVQDLAKARAMLRLVRSLEGPDFKVLVQLRGGLDYFSPDEDKARRQLAAVSMLMDDIEPDRSDSPDIVHVVSYCEGSKLATPDIINESIRITRAALLEYRLAKATGRMAGPPEPEVEFRAAVLHDDALLLEKAVERLVPDYLSPKGFLDIFAMGFLPVPWLWECREDFPRAVLAPPGPRAADRIAGVEFS